MAPRARAQLIRWERQAQAIPDPMLRSLALAKLREERFNAEVAATLATLAPRAQRGHVVEAIVALEVMYDYLDGLTEQPCADPIASGGRLYRAFTDALAAEAPPERDYYRGLPHSQDGGYLHRLSQAVWAAMARLPGAEAVGEVARHSAARCAQAQVRLHAAAHIGTDQLERWALAEASDTALGWRAFLAGAMASVLAVHALIAAGADAHATAEQAATLDAAYLSVSALSTMLDSLVDYETDVIAGEVGYLRYYRDRAALGTELAGVSRLAVAQVRQLPHAGHHLMTLVGVVAYYTSTPRASGDPAGPIIAGLHRELAPAILPTLAVMRAWRLAKRLHARLHEHPRAGMRAR